MLNLAFYSYPYPKSKQSFESITPFIFSNPPNTKTPRAR